MGRAVRVGGREKVLVVVIVDEAHTLAQREYDVQQYYNLKHLYELSRYPVVPPIRCF